MSNCRTSVTRFALVTFLYVSLALPCFALYEPDTTFATGGKLTLSFPDSTTNYSSSGLRIFVQPSGRIVAVGFFTRSTSDGQMPGVAAVGLTPGGTPDGTYNGGTIENWQSHGFTSLSDAVMYPDGRLLRLWRFFNVVGSSTVHASRLNADGSGDGTFNAIIGSGGGFGTASAVQIAVRSDGKINVLITDNGEYQLYRLNANGARDTTFGVNGVMPLQFNKMPMPSSAMEMEVLPDGKVLIAGHVSPFTSGVSSEFFMLRLTESGGLDKTFGRLGFLRVPFGPGLTGRVQRATIQPDGNILLCGSVQTPDTDVWMMRFRPNGRADNSFGNQGVVITDFHPGATDAASSVALSPDGKIRIAGYHGSPSNFMVARYTATGTLEESTSFNFTPGQAASASDIAIQADGKVVVIGGTRNPNMSITGNVFAIARLTE